MVNSILISAVGGAVLGAIIAFATGSTPIGIAVVASLGGATGAVVGYLERRPPQDRSPAAPLGITIALGVGIGTAVGVALQNHLVGIGIGVAIGIALAVGTRRRQGNKDAPRRG